MSILITGGAGFLGRYLTAHLEATRKEPITVVSRETPDQWPYRARLITMDLCNPEKVDELILQVRPREIYHLAGHSKVTSQLGMIDYFSANVETTARLVDSLRRLRQPGCLFLASSVHVYGNFDSTADESTDPQPVNDYGFTKYLAEEVLRKAVCGTDSMRVVVGRLYSCFGPGQAKGFVSADMCEKVARLPKEGIGVLKVGPVSTFRRFLDVRDAVTIIDRLCRSRMGEPFTVINIASPHEAQVRDLIEALLKISGKKARIESTEDNSDNRLFGIRLSSERMKQFIPDVRFRPLEETLRDMYAAAVAHLAGSVENHKSSCEK